MVEMGEGIEEVGWMKDWTPVLTLVWQSGVPAPAHCFLWSGGEGMWDLKSLSSLCESAVSSGPTWA